MEQRVQVKRVERQSQESLVLGYTIPGKSGWVATIKFDDGRKWVADRIDGEDRWHVNGVWAKASSFPQFWNGELSRCTMPVFVEDEALIEALVEEVAYAEWGADMDAAEAQQ